MTDVELDERVTALEENDGGGTGNGKLNDKFMHVSLFRPRSHLAMATQIFDVLTIFFYIVVTIALHTALTSYSSITVGSAVLFNQVLINEGDG